MSDIHSIQEGVKEWTVPVENVLASWSDMAACYIWLHDRAFRKLKGLQTSFSIPIIVLSTLTGTANFGMGSFVPAENMQLVQISIGIVNIFAGILGTLQSFFRYGENSEAHHNAMHGWAKFHRVVSTELALERESRKNADGFFKHCQVSIDQLMDSSPVLPMPIIHAFRKLVHSTPEVVRPAEIRDSFDHTKALDAILERKDEAAIPLKKVMRRSSPRYMQDLVEKVIKKNADAEKTTVVNTPWSGDEDAISEESLANVRDSGGDSSSPDAQLPSPSRIV
jgi:hypothetical protein